MRHPVISINFSKLISRVKQGGSVAKGQAYRQLPPVVNFPPTHFNMRHPVISRNFFKLISRVTQGGSVAERAAHIVNFLRLSTFLQPISRMHSWKENASFSHMLIRIGAAATYTTYLPTYYYILRTYCSACSPCVCL